MKHLLEHIRPVEQGMPVLRPFPLAFRVDNVRCCTYHASEDRRLDAAASLMQSGRACVLLPRLRSA
jgi:hypothetical protein